MREVIDKCRARYERTREVFDRHMYDIPPFLRISPEDRRAAWLAYKEVHVDAWVDPIAVRQKELRDMFEADRKSKAYARLHKAGLLKDE